MAYENGICHSQIPIYNRFLTTITLDKTGRVVIPKEIRDELHLEAGATLEIDSDGRAITLRPQRASSPLRKERGVWVHDGSSMTASEAEALLAEARRTRDQQAGG